jgi:uncharacterized membrane protein (UPF0127 family)
VFLSSLLNRPDERHVLRHEASGRTLAHTIEAAFDSKSRRRGLLGRDAMAEGTALIIAPCNSIHTWFMRFPIDVIFARKDGTVVKACEAVPAWRMRAALRAHSTIELPAGALRSCHVAPGDRLLIEPAGTGTSGGT